MSTAFLYNSKPCLKYEWPGRLCSRPFSHGRTCTLTKEMFAPTTPQYFAPMPRAHCSMWDACGKPRSPGQCCAEESASLDRTARAPRSPGRICTWCWGANRRRSRIVAGPARACRARLQCAGALALPSFSWRLRRGRASRRPQSWRECPPPAFSETNLAISQRLAQAQVLPANPGSRNACAQPTR